ncbi:MAG: aminopeptidase [Erysipelotrichaceae bacterium]|nr:aminopeptidase [Erysipelotrichaceae bacterium]
MKTVWEKYNEQQMEAVKEFNQGYKKYISDCKTERECVVESIRIAEEYGYKNLKDLIASQTAVKTGDKVYYNNMGKSLILFHIGEEPLENGMNILGAHIDSPRIDLKQHPIYEDKNLCLLKTHYYGGIKKYQWVTTPLAMHGVVCKKDGTCVNIVIGEDENDPVLGITDLLPHLARGQMEKPAPKIIEGEELNITFGSIPLKDEEKEPVKANIMKLLKDRYGIEEDDFMSAEIEIVPAGKARDYGLDRGMVMGYGQDDRVCAYTSLMALLDTPTQKKTTCALLVDKEEVGSIGATGMHSIFFENALVELLELAGGFSELKLRRLYNNTDMLSSDVSAGYDPTFPGVNEPMNSAYIGGGMCLNKYTGSGGKGGCNDANPEFIARIRAAFEKHDVTFQTAELGRVDCGGGGTIAYIMAQYNMNVIDAGVAVLSMHAPWEVTSQADVYETYRGYKAFLEEM